MPTLRALECLIAIDDHGSVTRAAEALGLTQPALSHQLGKLQRELGLELISRQRGGMRPNAAGRALLPRARAAVEAEQAFTALARRVSGLREGELHICCAASVTSGLLPPVLRRWSQRRRDVAVFLTEYDSADRVAAAVVAGDGDLGICPRPSSWDGPMTVLGWEEIVAVMPSNDPLAKRRTVTLADLAARPLVQYTEGHALAGWVDSAFAAAGVTPRVAVRTGQISAPATLAASGIGIALVPLSALPAHYRGVARRLAPKRGRDLVALSTTADDPLVDAFVRDLVSLGVPRLRSA